jgi:holo-[acyl-carrier protein] synthase
MAELVHALFKCALKERVLVGVFTVELAAQAMQRNDCNAPLLVRVPEDETVRGFVEIEIGDGEHQTAVIGKLPQHLEGEGGNEHLLTRGIYRAARNGECAFDRCVIKETLFQTKSEPLKKRRIDGVDRNDAQSRVHARAVSFDASANSPRMILGIGMDLAEVARYRFNEQQLAWFARKVYTEEEMAYAMRKRNLAERLAGFFAAKEAARKAFGHAIPWRSVGVSHERSGKPIIRLYGDAAALPERRGVGAMHLTITHTAGMAAAVVILEDRS